MSDALRLSGPAWARTNALSAAARARLERELQQLLFQGDDAKEGIAAYSWAPDSRRLAFIAADPRSNEETAQIKKKDDERVFEGDFRYRHLWVVEIADGASATRVTTSAFQICDLPIGNGGRRDR